MRRILAKAIGLTEFTTAGKSEGLEWSKGERKSR